ncbi:MAG: CRISPR-associated endonuclease Cas2 [Candidatus Portnoybacteria bacterium CG10_big_fil_rev_8_21_14_0_10_38_18]|uniref:CRISPR-associated endonuclease Cas2 n=1 Tax=Candidatus Portnoybacteria bacterium CG10_big_fil_rev_8_21_14_0_10_38_18 TaxID=1974813 RepID=A0A2M8KC72_9BACT|nr:MAG: CRISPR-associated endonuclease Cas2 [Candidatus Portnoybacteria bacterium CG10_big_fil_rev_8_21_14_0_10_38_18]
MRIKLPFTEKFLWDLYNFINKTGNITGKIVNEMIPEYGHHKSKAISVLMFPNFCIFRDKWEDRYKIKKRKNKNYFYKLIYDLKQRGYLKSLKVRNNSAIMITPRGIKKIFTTSIKLVDRKPRKDGKWQMILFDIPESKRRDRDLFRKALKYLGYKSLQKSIWVCEYDIEEKTKDLIKRYHIEPWVELLLVNKIGLE